jgi:hypothetical protein
MTVILDGTGSAAWGLFSDRRKLFVGDLSGE